MNFLHLFFLFFFYRILLKGVIEKVVRYHNGAWQKVNFVVLADKSLQRVENVFECVVKLPQTAYTVRRTMLYTPSKWITMNTMGWYPTIVTFFLHLQSHELFINYRGSLLSTIFGTWKKSYYVKFVLQSNLALRNFLVIAKLFTNANLFTIY